MRVSTLISLDVSRGELFKLKCQKNWLAGVWYPGRLTCRGIIPRGVMFWQIFYWLAGVWYPRETDLLGYITPGRLTRRGMIPRGVRFSDLKFEKLSKFLTKIGNILTRWSVAEKESNNEKNWRLKIRWTASLKWQFHEKALRLWPKDQRTKGLPTGFYIFHSQ